MRTLRHAPLGAPAVDRSGPQVAPCPRCRAPLVLYLTEFAATAERCTLACGHLRVLTGRTVATVDTESQARRATMAETAAADPQLVAGGAAVYSMHPCAECERETTRRKYCGDPCARTAHGRMRATWNANAKLRREEAGRT